MLWWTCSGGSFSESPCYSMYPVSVGADKMLLPPLKITSLLLYGLEVADWMWREVGGEEERQPLGGGSWFLISGAVGCISPSAIIYLILVMLSSIFCADRIDFGGFFFWLCIFHNWLLLRCSVRVKWKPWNLLYTNVKFSQLWSKSVVL